MAQAGSHQARTPNQRPWGRQLFAAAKDHHASLCTRIIVIGINGLTILFAVREVPQASTGFSPFELLFGRWPRGRGELARMPSFPM